MERVDYQEAAKEHLRGELYEPVKIRSKFPVDVLQRDVKKSLVIMEEKVGTL